MSHIKMSHFVSFPLFGFTLVTKLENFDFQSHGNTHFVFDQNNDVRFQSPIKQCLIWFKLTLFENNFGNKLRNMDFKVY